VKFKCLFGFHKFEFSRYKMPMENKALTPLVINLDGAITGGKIVSRGFIHYGLVSDCIHCGKTASSESMKLPIIEPRFNT
jgi:hypothetical protein